MISRTAEAGNAYCLLTTLSDKSEDACGFPAEPELQVFYLELAVCRRELHLVVKAANSGLGLQDMGIKAFSPTSC